MKLGIPKYYAHKWGEYIKVCWNVAGSPVLTRSITNERLAQRDTTVSSPDMRRCTYAIEPPCTERYARWCEGRAVNASYSILPSLTMYKFDVQLPLFR